MLIKECFLKELQKLRQHFQKCRIIISVHNFGTTKNREPAIYCQDRPGTINGTVTGDTLVWCLRSNDPFEAIVIE